MKGSGCSNSIPSCAQYQEIQSESPLRLASLMSHRHTLSMGQFQPQSGGRSPCEVATTYYIFELWYSGCSDTRHP